MSSKRKRMVSKRTSAKPRSRPAAAPAAQAPSRLSYHHGDLRAALLDAAHQLIREQGSAELSLREVARRAQVSHGAPAHHFRNKAGLLTAFAAQGFERLVAAIEVEEAERPARSGPDKLINTGRGYLRFALGNPAQFAIMYDTAALDLGDPAYVAATDRAFGLLTAAIAQCVAEGRLEAGEAHLHALTSWSLVHGLASLWIGGRLRVRAGPQFPPDLGDRVIDLYVKRLVGPAR